MRFGKRDSTHREIVDTLESVGCSVFDAADVGLGFPDLVVGFRGVTFLLECKSKRGKLRPSQVSFQRSWRGAPVAVVYTPAEALRAIGLPDVAAQLAR